MPNCVNGILINFICEVMHFTTGWIKFWDRWTSFNEFVAQLLVLFDFDMVFFFFFGWKSATPQCDTAHTMAQARILVCCWLNGPHFRRHELASGHVFLFHYFHFRLQVQNEFGISHHFGQSIWQIMFRNVQVQVHFPFRPISFSTVSSCTIETNWWLVAHQILSVIIGYVFLEQTMHSSPAKQISIYCCQ